jgi:hypothetical protein
MRHRLHGEAVGARGRRGARRCAAAEAADAAAANRARRGADGGRRAMPRAVTLALLHLLRQTQFSPDADDQ